MEVSSFSAMFPNTCHRKQKGFRLLWNHVGVVSIGGSSGVRRKHRKRICPASRQTEVCCEDRMAEKHRINVLHLHADLFQHLCSAPAQARKNSSSLFGREWCPKSSLGTALCPACTHRTGPGLQAHGLPLDTHACGLALRSRLGSKDIKK